MYVSFKLYTDAEFYSGAVTQLNLYKKIKSKIREWEMESLLRNCDTELTYHPSNGFLKVLNLPDIESSPGEEKELSETETNQIPKEIEDYIENLYRVNHIELKRHNHGKEMECGRQKEGKEYWRGMRNEEIAEVCSNCTRIALDILDKLEKNRESFKDDSDLRRHIIAQIEQKLGTDFPPDLRN